MSKKESRYYYSFISKVFKNIANNTGLTKNFKDQLNEALCIISKNISYISKEITIISEKKTISETEIEKSISFMVKDTCFLKEIFSTCEKALENYNNSNDTDISRQSMANIIFPVSIAEKFIRNFGHNNVMVTASSPIYLACFLELLTKRILSNCLTLSKEGITNRLTIRDLFLTIDNNTVIKDIFNFCGIKLIGGGVKSEIHSFLKNKKRKKNTKKEGEAKKHRFRPGTIALREIKKYQENYTDKLIFAKLPFEKLVRKIIYEKTGESIKISKEFFIILQYWLEDYLISFLKDCNLASIHAKRVKVSLEDLEFIRKLRGYPEIETV